MEIYHYAPLLIVVYGVIGYLVHRRSKKQHDEFLESIYGKEGDFKKELCQNLDFSFDSFSVNEGYKLKDISETLYKLSKTQAYRKDERRGSLVECADKLTSVLLAQKLQPLSEHNTLKIIPDLEKDFADRLSMFKSCSVKSEVEIKKDVQQFCETINEYAELVDSWYNLKETIASDAIITEASYHEKYGKDADNDNSWLTHGLGLTFEVPESGERYKMLQWEIFQHPKLLENITNWISKERKDAKWRPGAICGLSSTGMPLAALLTTSLNKKDSNIRLLAIDVESSESNLICPTDIDDIDPKKVLLVDSGVQTGKHIKKATELLAERGLEIEGIICVSLNDFLPDGGIQDEFVQEMIKQEKLKYIFEISDIYNTRIGISEN